MNTELHAIRDRLKFWINHNQGRARVMSDSTEAIHAILSDQDYKGIEEECIQEVKELIKSASVVGVYYCQEAAIRFLTSSQACKSSC